jgi:hypothetical protein
MIERLDGCAFWAPWTLAMEGDDTCRKINECTADA